MSGYGEWMGFLFVVRHVESLSSKKRIMYGARPSTSAYELSHAHFYRQTRASLPRENLSAAGTGLCLHHPLYCRHISFLVYRSFQMDSRSGLQCTGQKMPVDQDFHSP